MLSATAEESLQQSPSSLLLGPSNAATMMLNDTGRCNDNNDDGNAPVLLPQIHHHPHAHHRYLIDEIINETFHFPARHFPSRGVVNDFSTTPRFGHSSHFADFFGTAEEAEDYMKGLLVLGIALGVLYVLWFGVVLVFYCVQPKRVGFLSGKPFQRQLSRTVQTKDVVSSATSRYSFSNKAYAGPESIANETTLDDQGLSDGKDAEDSNGPGQQQQRHQQQHVPSSLSSSSSCGGCLGRDCTFWVRWAFVFSGVTIVVFSFLFVTKGVARVEETADNLNAASGMVIDLTTDADAIARSLLTSLDEGFATMSRSLQEELSAENICPASPILNQSLPIVQRVQALAVQALQALEQIDVLIDSAYVRQIEASLARTERQAQMFYDTTYNMNIPDWISILFIALYVTTTLIICFSTCSVLYQGTTNRHLHRSIVWIVFPFFVVLTIVAAFISSGSLIAASANADYCQPNENQSTNMTALTPVVSNQTTAALEFANKDGNFFVNAPDVSSLLVLQNEGFTVDSLEYKLAFFYITQCSSYANPFEPILTGLQHMDLANNAFVDFKKEFHSRNATLTLELACGRGFDGLRTAMDELERLVLLSIGSVWDLLGLIRCDSLVPIYQKAFYDATCYSSMKGMVWIFSSSFILTVFGLFMITIRSSYSATEEIGSMIEDDDKNDDNNYNNNNVSNVQQEQAAPVSENGYNA